MAETMSNATLNETVTEAPPKSTPGIPPQYILYLVQGGFIMVANALIVIAVGRYKQMRLRKEYIIVASLALADTLGGAAYFTAAVHRIPLILAGRSGEKVSAWSCMMTLHGLLFVLGAPMVGMMLLLVSVDRLIAVAVPLKYFTFSATYAWYLSGSFMAYCVLSFIMLVVVSYNEPDTKDYGIICLAESAVGNDLFKRYYYGSRVFSGTASTFVYVLVPILFMRYLKKTNAGKNQNASVIESQTRTQRRLIVTLGISAVCTFIFYVIPNMLRMLFAGYFDPVVWRLVVPYLASIQNINPMLNIFLYVTRHADMRLAILSVIMCKSTPMQPPKVTNVATKTTK